MKNLSAFPLILLGLLLSSLAFAQKTNFTVADAINVKSIGNTALSDDGKLLAGLISDGRARFDVDHFRFQDPSYLNVLPGEFVILDTQNGEMLYPYKEQSRVTSFSWSPNSKELAFLEQKGDKLHLMLYDTNRKRIKEININGNPLLANSDLTWTSDGKSILLHARNHDWLDGAVRKGQPFLCRYFLILKI